MLESLITTTDSGSVLSIWEAILYSITSGVLGLIVSLTYLRTGKVSKNFARTLVVLPILVCVVMIAVNGNLGASVAVLGAFSLVRFRSLQGTSREIGFVFFDMTVGICCAIGQLALALIITLFVCMLHFILDFTGFGAGKNDLKNLRITIPENLDYSNIFDDLFEQYTHEHKLVAVKTTNMGSLYELSYEVRLLDDRNEKSFIDEVRTRNGNLTVICGRCDKNELEEL